MKIDHFIL